MSVDHTSKMFLLSTTGLLTSATTNNIITSYYLLESIRTHPHMRGKRAQALTFLELKHAVRIHPKSWGEFGHSLMKY